jgi:cyclic pyranopterin phosphate synthase
MVESLDALSRPLHDLRVSVTDRCNLRCAYCMPAEVFGPDHSFMPDTQLLSFEEIVRVSRAFVAAGVRRVRLTGGEPLLRRGLQELVRGLAEVAGLQEIALTTNGTLLAATAHALAEAGLTRVTVSLDSLQPAVLDAASGRRFPLQRVLDGIDAAADAGLGPVKVNMVVCRGSNEDCIVEMAEHFRGRQEVLRFIEYMDVGDTNDWTAQDVVTADEVRRLLEAHWPLEALQPTRHGEVATRWRYRDGAGEIGFIHAVSKPFCGDCTRARLSADGRLYTCLFAACGSDLRAPLRAGATDHELQRIIRQVWAVRSDRYSELRPRSAQGGTRRITQSAADGPPRIEMSYIGG